MNAFHDLRYGLRILLKSPVSTAVAVAALGLGIGANSAIFSVLSATLLRPIASTDSSRLVVIWETKLNKGILQDQVSPPDFRDFADQQRVFDQLAALRAHPAVLTGGQLPERVETASVSPSMFDLLGLKPALGRILSPEEDQPARSHVALLSYGLWQRRFESDRAILGKPVIVDGTSYTVVGVAPKGFQLLDTPSELWVPYTSEAAAVSQRGFRTLRVVARMKPGVSLEQARSDLRAIAAGLDRLYPDTNAGWSANVVSLRDQMAGDIRPTVWTLMAAVTFVLLIACANVANLLLARAGAREKEMAIRTALGANPVRIVRQLLTESALLGLAGGIFGLLLAAWCVALLGRVGPTSLVKTGPVDIDWRVLVFTFGVSILTGVAFGLAPAISTIRADLNTVLKTSSRGTTGSRGRARLRNGLVVIEIASCVVLLAGAGLLIRSLLRLEKVNPGFRPDHVLTMQVSLPETRYSEWKVAFFYKQLLDKMRVLPGVQRAGVARNLPLSGVDASLNFVVENRAAEPSAEQPRAKYRAASADYFEAMGIPLIQGRFFNQTDGEKTPGVVVINETMAKRFWPSEDPVGKRMKAGFDDSEWCTIIGIARDVKHTGLDSATNAEMYYHYLQIPPALMGFVESTMTLVLRTSGAPAPMATPARNEIRNLDPQLAVFNVKSMDELVDGALSQPRLRTLLLGVFAGLALMLAAIGLYGVIAYSVTQRVNELGIRMALGAQKSDVLKMVVGEGAILAAMGIAIGLAAAFGLMRAISKLLFGVTANDWVTFAATSLVILVVALVASYLPALKAIRVDPVVALRCE